MKNVHTTPIRKIRRRRGTARLFVLGAVFLAPVAAAGSAHGATIEGQSALERTNVLQFDIPSGPLATAAEAFERVTGLNVSMSDPGLATLQSPGVSGSLTAEQAMTRLLSGLAVRARFSAIAVALDLQGVSEFVTVEVILPKVASPKYQATLRDTPQTVVVIPQAVYSQQGATSLREVLRNTPGITSSIGEGPSGIAPGDAVLIRGFSARNDIYIDGARDVGAVYRDAFNTEAVEVAKGPTSVTGGRGATGGSINLVSKTPGIGDSLTLRVAGGSADYKRSTVDGNYRINHLAAVRVNAMWQDTGYAGRDVAKYKSWGLAPSLVVGLTTPTRLTVSYSRMKQNNIPDWGLPTLLPDVALNQGVTVNDLDFSNFYGIASRDYEHTTSDVATAILDHRFDRTFSIRNLTRYGKNYRDTVATPPRPVTTTAGQGPEDPGYNRNAAQIRRTDTKYLYRDDRVITNQSDLTATFKTGALSHRADVGLEIARDHQPTFGSIDLFTNGRPPVDDLFEPTPYVAYSPAIVRSGASSEANAQSSAVYAFDTITMGSRWQADLGLRWDRINVDFTTVSAPTTAAPTGVRANFARTDKAVTGRGGIVFKPVPEGSIYAAYGTSFTPAFDGTQGLNIAATGINNPTLPAERSNNIEAGIKWGLSAAQLTAAVFQLEKTNARTANQAGEVVLQGHQRVRGVEFGVSGNLTPRWGVFGGLALMEGTVVDAGVPIANSTILNGSPGLEIGQQLAYLPKRSMNLWTTYRLPINLTLGGGANYASGHYFNNTGGFLYVSGATAQPKYVANAAAIQALTKYWVFNAVAIYPINRYFELQVNGYNLADKRYVDRAYDRHFMPGPGRQIVVAPVITF